MNILYSIWWTINNIVFKDKKITIKEEIKYEYYININDDNNQRIKKPKGTKT